MRSWTFATNLVPPRLRRLAPALLAVAFLVAGALAYGRQDLLPNGAKAPDFTVDADGGGKMQFSAQKGKVVVLDFWATWCGPCQQSLPHLERVAKKVAGQNVVILGVCVLDSRDHFDAWTRQRRSEFSFRFYYDPAGRSETNIASSLYHVRGIPTTYIIGPDGKVAETIVGFNGDGDNRVERALARLGIKVA